MDWQPKAVGAVAAAVVLASLLGCGRPGRARVPRPERIILFSMDTVRTEQVNGYGPGNRTPALAEIAAEGALFRDAYAASTYTIPSHMSVFTGLDPAEHGVHSSAARLSSDVPTLAEALSEAGYLTGAFHEGGYVHPRFGFGRGFDHYEEHERVSLVDTALPEVLDWMRSAEERPYFLFLHTYAAHFPYGGLERYRSESPERGLPTDAELRRLRRSWNAQQREQLSDEERELYTVCNQLLDGQSSILRSGDRRLSSTFPESPYFEADRAAMVESYGERIALIDGALARIRDLLIELDQWEGTLLVVLSDHGEAFFEHGLEKHDYVPFNEVVKVPLVISYPRLLRSSPVHVVEGLAWHLDVMPTILGLAGVAPPAGLRGIDLTPAMLGEAPIPEDRIVFPAVLRPAQFEQEPLRRVALRRELKYVEGHELFGDAGGFLFDLAADPDERVNLRSERMPAFDSLARAARGYALSLSLRVPVHQKTGRPLTTDAVDDPPVGLSEEELQRLRALGYAE